MVAKAELLQEIETVLDAPPGSLRGSDQLSSFASWDSLAVVSVLALADEKAGKTLGAADIRGCKTVDDVLALMGAGAIQ